MMGGQLRRRALVSVVLALCSGAASADPASLIMLGASWMANGAVWYVAAAWLAGGAIVSSALRRSEQRAANRAARAKAINELQARTVTALQADPAWRVVYGEATVGGDIHAIITHDKTNGKREDGSTYTRPDAYKSLVIVWADHQCKGVKTILINGIDIGAVDASGWVTGGTYMGAGTESRRTQFAAGTSTITLTEAIVEVLMCTEVINGTHVSASYTLSNGNKTLTLVSPNGAATARWLNYTVSKGVPRVRVEHYRGTSSQTARTYLIAQAPAQWTANHRLRGKCYSVVTLDLEDTRFMAGWGDILAVVEGHDQIYDPRTGTAGYTTNNALICNNWLQAPWGYGADVITEDVNQPRLIAAANACDVSTSYTEGTTTITGPRYTCNGGLSTDQGKEQVLEDLRESMAGHVAFDGQWLIDAGAWSTPVLALTDADLAGPIELVQAGSPSGELFNSIRTQYLPPLAKAVAEADPYVNATLVAADGKSLWGDLTLPFTNTKARCRQIARVVTERSRDGQILRIPLKRRALRLQVGDRFTLTNTEYGLTAKTYRATDISVVPQGGLVVTAQEDAADVYDTADASSADPNPNTGLQSPLVVAAMGALTVTSGTAELVLLKDGTVVPRVKIAWGAVQDPYVVAGGFVETRWRAVDSIVWNDWRQAPGDALSVYLDGMTERLPIIIEARLRNSMGYLGASAYASHVVAGKLAAPTNVANLIATVSGGQAIIAMDPCPDADYAETEVRIGNTSSTWATATRLGIGNQNLFGWMPYPAVGGYNVFAVHYDTSGNASTPQAIVATVTAAGITSAASGTNLVMNGDFYSRLPADGHPYGWDLLEFGRNSATAVWGFTDSVAGRDGIGKAAALVCGGAATYNAGSYVGILGGKATFPGGLVQGGVSGGWRPGHTYTVQYWAKRIAAQPGGGGGAESAIANLASTGQSGTTPTGTGTVSMTLPTVAAGSLHIVVASLDDYATAGIAAPAGWTRIGSQQGATGNPDGRVTSAWYKIAAAGDPAAFVLSVTGGGGFTYSMACSSYSGCDTTTPVSVVGAWSAAGAGIATNQPITAAGITTTGNTGIVWLGATDKASGPANTLTAPSGFAMRRSQWDSTNASNAHIADKLPKAANGTVAATSGTLASGGAGYDVVMIALKPATSGGGGAAAGIALWDDMHLYFDVAPSTIERVAVPAPSESWQLYQYRITWGASVQGNGGVLPGYRMASGAALPASVAGDKFAFDDVMVHLGTDFPAFERSPQDDLRAESIVTGALAPYAATLPQAAAFTGVAIAAVSFTPDGYSRNTQIATVTFTPAVSCVVNLSAIFDLSYTTSASNDTAYLGVRIQDLASSWAAGLTVYSDALEVIGTSKTMNRMVAFSKKLAVVGGVTYTFGLYGKKLTSGDAASANNGQLQYELMYR